MSRLTMDITNRQHQNLEALAALQGNTIKQYALERVFPGDANDDQAWQELQALLDERINEGLSGKVSAKSVGKVANEELDNDDHAPRVQRDA